MEQEPEDSTTEPRTRDRLLAAGIELMVETPVGTGVNHIKATEVSRRAGLSHGAFYHHWSSQEDFQIELLHHAIQLGRNPAEADQFRKRVEAADLTNPSEAIRTVMNEAFEEADLVAWRIWVALLARNDPQTDALLRDRYQEVVDAYTPAVAEAFGPLMLRIRPPMDLDRLSVLTDALWEGLALRRTVDADAIDGASATDRFGKEWSLYALGAAAMLVGCTEPIGGVETDLLDAIDRLGAALRERPHDS